MTNPATSFLRSLLLALCATFLGVGCVSPWTVRQQAEPNPLVGQKGFDFRPLTYEGMIVGNGSEQEHLADKDAEQRASWEDDKRKMADGFLRALQDEAGSKVSVRPGGGSFVVEPRAESLEPGIFTGVFNRPALLSCIVRILDAQGGLIDEIKVGGFGHSTIYNPTVNQRLLAAARLAGVNFGKYIKDRTQGD